MLSARESLLLGYLVPTIGAYFRTVALLRECDAAEDAALRDALAEREELLFRQQDETIRDVRSAEALARKIALPLLSSPRDPDEYGRWAQRLLETADVRLSRREPGARAPQGPAWHVLGFLLGEAWTTLNLGGVVLAFLAVAPEHAWLLGQLDTLGAQQQKLTRQLDGATQHTAWNQAQRMALGEVLAALRGAPPLLSTETAPHGHRREQLSRTLVPLAAQIRVFHGLTDEK